MEVVCGLEVTPSGWLGASGQEEPWGELWRLSWLERAWAPGAQGMLPGWRLSYTRHGGL